MKKNYFILCLIALVSLSSFASDKACEYAGSNLNYSSKETKNALAAEDINIAKYHAYKALNAIEKSKKQLNECGCKYALKNVQKSLTNLKKATRATSFSNVKKLLEIALKNSTSSIKSIEEHELHESEFSNGLLAMNTSYSGLNTNKKIREKQLQNKIDKSLVKFRKSLNEVVTTIECKQAYEFASNIFKICEKELLEEDLSEAKRYYNLRTKIITEEALAKLAYCAKK
ncbi:MAG: hypothetical protein V3U92_18650 [Cellulophaga sp.]